MKGPFNDLIVREAHRHLLIVVRVIGRAFPATSLNLSGDGRLSIRFSGEREKYGLVCAGLGIADSVRDENPGQRLLDCFLKACILPPNQDSHADRKVIAFEGRTEKVEPKRPCVIPRH